MEERGGKPPFPQAVHGDQESLAFDRYYLFRAYRLRSVQQRFMRHIGYRSVEKYLTSSEMSDIVGMELEGTPMVFRKRTPRLRGQLCFCIKTHFKSITGAQKALLASCLRISGDIKPPGTIVPGGFSLSKTQRRAREGRSPLEFKSSPAACTSGAGRFLRRKIPFSRAKIVTLQILRPGISKKS